MISMNSKLQEFFNSYQYQLVVELLPPDHMYSPGFFPSTKAVS